ncbi:unnamed protein product, partial [Allacma fusca]
IRDKQEH